MANKAKVKALIVFYGYPPIIPSLFAPDMPGNKPFYGTF